MYSYATIQTFGVSKMIFFFKDINTLIQQGCNKLLKKFEFSIHLNDLWFLNDHVTVKTAVMAAENWVLPSHE